MLQVQVRGRSLFLALVFLVLHQLVLLLTFLILFNVGQNNLYSEPFQHIQHHKNTEAEIMMKKNEIFC